MEHTPKNIKTLIAKVEKWNKDFRNYVATTGDDTLPSVDCTFFDYDKAAEYTIKEFKTKFVVTDMDGNRYELKTQYDGDFYELEESIRYDRRRLAKAWRIFKSENPDAEELKDTEEE